MIKKILRQIQSNAELPLCEARALPFEAYTSPDLLQLEIDNIFRREWICVGREDELLMPGDYLTHTIAGEPVLVKKGSDGVIRAFSNVCQHRGMKLLEGCGNTKNIVCPYHAWSYRDDGSLSSAGMWSAMDESLRNACSLPQFPCYAWHGWIYVNLDKDARLPEAALSSLGEVIGPYNCRARKTVFRHKEVWNTNWKCLAENFMESYHVFKVHSKTIQPTTPTSSVRCYSGGGQFAYHTLDIKPGKEVRLSGHEKLSENIRHLEVLGCIFPTHLVSVMPSATIWLSLSPLPESAGQVEILTGIALDTRFYINDSVVESELPKVSKHLALFNAEDRKIVETLYSGYQSRVNGGGPLHRLEQPLWEFTRYLSARLEG